MQTILQYMTQVYKHENEMKFTKKFMPKSKSQIFLTFDYWRALLQDIPLQSLTIERDEEVF